MDKVTFRYNRGLGGGAFLDTSPYVASIGRFFFDAIPVQCYYLENSMLKNGIETSL